MSEAIRAWFGKASFSRLKSSSMARNGRSEISSMFSQPSRADPSMDFSLAYLCEGQGENGVSGVRNPRG
jgi:hypothetical protein